MPDRRRIALAVVAFLLLDLTLIAPAAGMRTGWWLPALSGDLVLLLTLVVAVRVRATAWVAALLWMLLFGYQLIALTSWQVLFEVALLFEIGALVENLVAAVLDAYGNLALLTGLGALLAVGVAGTVLAQRVLQYVADTVRAAELGGRRTLGVLWLFALVGLVLPGDLPAQWVAPSLAKNLWASYGQLRALQELTSEDRYAGVLDLEPQRTPDVHVYVVSSYGRAAYASPEMRRDVVDEVKFFHRRIFRRGWWTASAFAHSPVSGGRGWLADATVLTGLTVDRDSTYLRLTQEVDKITHLPQFMAASGYHTTIVSPVTQAMLGRPPSNDLGWQRAVFFEDLEYVGPQLGRGWVPDQYTLGWLRTNVLGTGPAVPVAGEPEVPVLPPVEGAEPEAAEPEPVPEPVEAEAPPEDRPPLFVYTNLVTSHHPWKRAPRVMRHWTRWNELQRVPLDRGPADDSWGALGTSPEETSPEEGVSEEGVSEGAAPEGPEDEPEPEPEPSPEEPTEGLEARYVDVIRYELRELLKHVGWLDSERPTLVLILGDHQPPRLGEDQDFGVPVHVLASDQELLGQFMAAGFTYGMVPRGTPSMGLEELFPLLSRVITDDPVPLPEIKTRQKRGKGAPVEEPADAVEPEAPGGG